MHSPVRKIRNNSYRKSIGKFASIKMSRMVYWESILERDYIYLVEADPQVTAYYEQPCKIQYEFDSKQRNYTPDFLVEKIGDKKLVEVKPKEKADTPKYTDMFDIVRPICEKNGYKFEVVTDEDIRTGPRLRNIQLLYNYARIPIPNEAMQTAEKVFLHYNKLSLRDLTMIAQTEDIRLAEIYSMMYWGYFDFDMDQEVSQNSMLSWRFIARG